jgi:uncharacterized repeat protein (TIGR03803 family)
MILSGNTLYGLTIFGGTNFNSEYSDSGDGTIFSLPVSGGTPTTVAAFNGTDGMFPSTLVLSGSTIYGTTTTGGVGYNGNFATGNGVVFSIPATGGTPTILTEFSGSNLANPRGLIQVGNLLIGTTTTGGTYGLGTLFSLPLTGGTPTVLVNFNGTDGYAPSGNLFLIGNTLYGSTENGGASEDGSIYSVQLPEPSLAVLLIIPLTLTMLKRPTPTGFAAIA